MIKGLGGRLELMDLVFNIARIVPPTPISRDSGGLTISKTNERS
jgi:hypothetical protein